MASPINEIKPINNENKNMRLFRSQQIINKVENNISDINPVIRPLYVLLGLIAGISFFPPINLPPMSEKESNIHIEKN